MVELLRSSNEQGHARRVPFIMHRRIQDFVRGPNFQKCLEAGASKTIRKTHTHTHIYIHSLRRKTNYYQLGDNRSMVDHLMVRKTDRCLVKDVKVI